MRKSVTGVPGVDGESEGEILLRKWKTRGVNFDFRDRPFPLEFSALESLHELRDDPLKVIREIDQWWSTTSHAVEVLGSGLLDVRRRGPGSEDSGDELNEQAFLLLQTCELHSKRLAIWCDLSIHIVDPTPLLRFYERLNAAVWRLIEGNDPIYTHYLVDSRDQDWEGKFWYACSPTQLRDSFCEARLAVNRMKTIVELRYVEEREGKPPTEQTLASKWDVAETMGLPFPKGWRRMETFSRAWGKPFEKGSGRSHDRWNWLDPILRRELQKQFHPRPIPLELKKANRSPYSKKNQ